MLVTLLHYSIHLSRYDLDVVLEFWVIELKGLARGAYSSYRLENLLSLRGKYNLLADHIACVGRSDLGKDHFCDVWMSVRMYCASFNCQTKVQFFVLDMHVIR